MSLHSVFFLFLENGAARYNENVSFWFSILKSTINKQTWTINSQITEWIYGFEWGWLRLLAKSTIFINPKKKQVSTNNKKRKKNESDVTIERLSDERRSTIESNYPQFFIEKSPEFGGQICLLGEGDATRTVFLCTRESSLWTAVPGTFDVSSCSAAVWSEVRWKRTTFPARK